MEILTNLVYLAQSTAPPEAKATLKFLNMAERELTVLIASLVDEDTKRLIVSALW
jgi:hypothetical protein